MCQREGFSLIELLIVVAIILIIAAIAIPNLLRSRMVTNEASAVSSVRTINTAEVTYNSTYNDGFANTLPLLGGAAGVAATCNNAAILERLPFRQLLQAAPTRASLTAIRSSRGQSTSAPQDSAASARMGQASFSPFRPAFSQHRLLRCAQLV